MVNIQADMLVPGWNELMLAIARSERLLHEIVRAVDIAGQRNREGAQTRHRRQHRLFERGSERHAVDPSLSPFFCSSSLLQHLDETVRHAVAHDAVVHGAQLLTDLVLDIASKPASRLSLGGFCLHVFGPAWLVVLVHRFSPPDFLEPVAPPAQWGITPATTGLFQIMGTFFETRALDGP